MVTVICTLELTSYCTSWEFFVVDVDVVSFRMLDDISEQPSIDIVCTAGGGAICGWRVERHHNRSRLTWRGDMNMSGCCRPNIRHHKRKADLAFAEVYRNICHAAAIRVAGTRRFFCTSHFDGEFLIVISGPNPKDFKHCSVRQ